MFSKLDLTKFEDKGAKVSLDEFLKHPMWTFRVPMNRLAELKKAEKAVLIKILETEQNAVTFIVFPQLKFEREKYRVQWSLFIDKEYISFINLYFDEFKQRLERFVKRKHPLSISLKKFEYQEFFDKEDEFKAFFDTETFRGVRFDFKEGTDLSESVGKYNETKSVKNTLEWIPETESQYPAVYVRPEKYREPSTPENSKKWLEEFVGGASRLTVLKAGLRREVDRILEGKPEPAEEDEREKREKAVEALKEVIDDLTSNDWQVVIGIQTVKYRYEVVMEDKKPILQLDENASILKDQEADFALRLCKGAPLSEEQQKALGKFVE